MATRTLFNDNLRYNLPYTVEMNHELKEYVLKNREYSRLGSPVEKHFETLPDAIFFYDDTNRPRNKKQLDKYQKKVDAQLIKLREYKDVSYYGVKD